LSSGYFLANLDADALQTWAFDNDPERLSREQVFRAIDARLRSLSVNEYEATVNPVHEERQG
jgi:hypothetical protein